MPTRTLTPPEHRRCSRSPIQKRCASAHAVSSYSEHSTFGADLFTSQSAAQQREYRTEQKAVQTWGVRDGSAVRTTSFVEKGEGGKKSRAFIHAQQRTWLKRRCKGKPHTLINVHKKMQSSYLMQTMEYACFAFLQRWPTSRTQKNYFNK